AVAHRHRRPGRRLRRPRRGARPHRGHAPPPTRRADPGREGSPLRHRPSLTPTRTHKENAHHDYPHHHLRRRPPRGRYEHRLGHPQGHVPHPHRRHPHHRRGGGRRVVRLGPVRHRGAP